MPRAQRYDRSVIDDRPANVARQFLDRVAATPHAEAYRYPVDNGSDNGSDNDSGDGWASLTWAVI